MYVCGTDAYQPTCDYIVSANQHLQKASLSDQIVSSTSSTLLLSLFKKMCQMDK